ncbi:hypothetical protein L3X38_003359 [Prunus dulcis]|uniref:Uncharacterized protein n=1 Tax=Prunus dulcis TaxID=3755 RepID=A0AAD4ZLX8_PRUDU|nr:hypothetical protein L3X38_003359 [Prunus dulcis]
MTLAISCRCSSSHLPIYLYFVGEWSIFNGYLNLDVSLKTCAKASSSVLPPAYISGVGVDQHAIEVRSKLHSYTQKNLDENVLHMFENTLVLGPHRFGTVPEEMVKLFKEDAEDPLCFQTYFALASPTWVSKNLSRSYSSSEVRSSAVKDENLLAAALCFWNSASNTFDFRVGLMTPTLLDMAQNSWKAC